MPYFVAFLEFAHQTARETAEIAHPRGIRRSVMVVTCKHHYPAISPLPCFAQCYHAQKRGVIAGFYGINGGVMFARKSSSYVGIMQSRFIGDTATSHGGMLDP